MRAKLHSSLADGCHDATAPAAGARSSVPDNAHGIYPKVGAPRPDTNGANPLPMFHVTEYLHASGKAV